MLDIQAKQNTDCCRCETMSKQSRAQCEARRTNEFVKSSNINKSSPLKLLSEQEIAKDGIAKYLNDAKPKNARYTLWPRRFARHLTERGDRAIEKYVSLAKKHNLTSVKLANSFVNDRPFVTSNIIGATSMDQLKENINSINITLSEDILNSIQEIHSHDPNPCV